MPRLVRLLPLGLVLSFAAAPALAGLGPAFQEREAEALAKLSSSNRRSYFNDLRAIERRRSLQRQADLSRLEACLSVRANGNSCMQEQQRKGMAQRLQWKQELQALRDRYNLPERQRRAPERPWR